MSEPLRIANCSGFYGDRLAAAREMVEGGPIDVLTGDWLAELTMLILAKDRARRADAGYARTFLPQLREVLAECAARGIRIVSNAGGLQPAGCAAAVRALAAELGVEVTVAHVEGDDLLPRLDELRAAGYDLGKPVTANAYLGAWGIVEALRRGADVVVTGRVTDASVVVGPAAWHFGWDRTDWDELSSAVVAGHLIECGCQVTGGNYAFFGEVPDLTHPGFPLVELHADGSFVVTKHPGTGGLVSVGTVTAQLLYEVQGTEYVNPDAVVRLNSVRLEPAGPDRVRVHGVRGLPGPAVAKVATNELGGYRNTMTFVLTGLDREAKAVVAEEALWASFPDGRATFEQVDVQLRAGIDTAELAITVMDADEHKVGRAFSRAVTELTLANYPGLFTTTPPGDARAFGIYTPHFVPTGLVDHVAVVGDARIAVPPAPTSPPPLARRAPKTAPAPARPKVAPTASTHPETIAALRDDLNRRRLQAPAGYDDSVHWDSLPTVRLPLGRVAGARSGDKGGDANVGVWVRTEDAYDWLQWYLDVDRVRALLGAEVAGLVIERFELPNVNALNFVVHGLLGRGVASSTRYDPQAKGLGEHLRAQPVDIPRELLAE